MHVVFAAGGTAGHLEPALTTADALVQRDPTTTISFIGGSRGLEGELVATRGYPLVATTAQPFPRRLSASAVAFPFVTIEGVWQAAAHLRAVSADVVVGFGGYAAVPGYAAAWLTRTPLIIHEANSRAGFANVLGAKWTKNVASVHSGVLAHARPMGLPLRPSVAQLDVAEERSVARGMWDLPDQGPVVLIFGGSQGARHLNDVVAGSIHALTDAGVSVLHAVGRNNVLPDPHPNYRPVAYIDRMDMAYAAADLVVCRSGAMTCAELTAIGVPAIYVPLPIGTGEQAGNSRPIVDAGGGLQVADEAVTSEWLTTTALSLVQDEGRLQTMASAARCLGDRDAGEAMVRWIDDVVERRRKGR